MKRLCLLLALATVLVLCTETAQALKEKPDEYHAEQMALRKKEIKAAAKEINNITYATNLTLDDFIENNETLVVVFYDDREEKSEDDLKIYAAEIYRAKHSAVPVFVNVNQEKQLAKRFHVKFEPMVKIYADGILLNQFTREYPLTPINVEFLLKDLDLNARKWNPFSAYQDKDYFKKYFPVKRDPFHLVCLCWGKEDPNLKLVKRFGLVPGTQIETHLLKPNEINFGKLDIRNMTMRKQLQANEYKGIVIVNSYRNMRMVVPEHIKTARELNRHIRSVMWQPVTNLFGIGRDDMRHETEAVMVMFVAYGEKKRLEPYLQMLNETSERGNLAGKINLFLMTTNEPLADLAGIDTNKTVEVAIMDNLYSYLYMNSYIMPDPVTPENMLKHYDDYINDRLQLPYKTQKDAPEFENGLKVLTTANFEEYIMNSGKDTLVLYHKYQCNGECENLRETLRKVQKRLEDNPNIQFAVCSYSKNELSKYVRVGKKPHLVIHPAVSPLKSVDWSFRPSNVAQDSIIEFLRAETSFSWIKAKPKIHDEV